MKTIRSVSLLFAVVAATSACEKNAVQVIAVPPEGGANVKFFNYAVGSPQVNFYVNDRKATAVSATGCFILDDTNRAECLAAGREATTGVAYGGAGNGTTTPGTTGVVTAWYSDVAPGQVTISGRIAATTDKNLPIANLQTTLAADKFYSFYLSGIYNTTAKTSDAFIVEDVLPAQDFAVAHVRFVNASSTAQPMTLFLTNRDSTATVTTVGAATAYKSASEWVAVPEGSYDLAARVTGSSTNLFSRTGVSLNAGRAYTIAARGNTATASTMSLDIAANR